MSMTSQIISHAASKASALAVLAQSAAQSASRIELRSARRHAGHLDGRGGRDT